MAPSLNSVACWVCLTLLAATATAAEPGPAPPDEAVGRFTLPDGFTATLFAGEPDVVQPIAFTFDDRGRLWVVENYSYPGWKGEGKDRIVIFADDDGDGRFDRRTVFLDNGRNLSGIEWGFGGVWLCSTPNLVFIPDRDRDDAPDGEPEIVLDGWDVNAQHNVASSLAWGPDGWLYGCNGILSNSNIGTPSTAAEARTPMNCGVWRCHPVARKFEVVAHGTTNPWGLDFDQYGQAFITNCVIQHLWHVVPGARFQRMFGQDFNVHSYRLMPACADHLHWAGGPWQEARGGERHDSYGGGHAHVGAMVYLGDNWPAEYRQRLFTCNLHGNRVNQDVLERVGSGYVARHATDFLLAGDPWFRGMMVKYGPDGGVYISDWSDTGECHNYEVVDRRNGRIFKVVYGRPTPWKQDLTQQTDAELVALQRHKNEWLVRHARRLLQERAAAGTIDAEASRKLHDLLRNDADPVIQLRAFWALHAIGAADEPLLLETMDSNHDVVRGWAVQLALESLQPSPQALEKLEHMAVDDPSPWTRLAIAAGLQRLPLAARWPIASGLMSHASDAADANLPLMIWYGVEPLVGVDPARALTLARQSQIPLVAQHIVRRLAASADAGALAMITKSLAEGNAAWQMTALAGLHEAIEGRRTVAMPPQWPEVYAGSVNSPDAEVRRRATRIGLIFGDPRARANLIKIAADTSADAADRSQAIADLVQIRAPEVPALLESLLSDSSVCVAVLRGFASLGDSATPQLLLARYASYDAAARQEAVSVLAGRVAWAMALLDAVEAGAVPRADLSAFHIQQLQNLNEPGITERLTNLWGVVRATPEDRAAEVSAHKAHLTPDVVAAANLGHGRALFDKSCSACHRLFGAGGAIGPELTGSQRSNLDYVLTNILDPSAIVPQGYRQTIFQTADGRILSGLVAREDAHVVEVQTPTELVRLPKEEIESREISPLSLMPDGLLSGFAKEDVRDLVAYLASPQQTPLTEPPAANSGSSD